jgi:hypothetical protein
MQTTSPTSAPHAGFAQRPTRPTLDHGSVGNSRLHRRSTWHSKAITGDVRECNQGARAAKPLILSDIATVRLWRL